MSDAKSEILGMPWGTAQNRLRKLVLFKVVQIAGLDSCFKCGAKIETAEAMSIEHKIPWKTAEEFWDLSNIAFSHRACNGRGRGEGKGYADPTIPPGECQGGCDRTRHETPFVKNRGICVDCYNSHQAGLMKERRTHLYTEIQRVEGNRFSY